ncbi:uncharacterized protein LOC100121437 isoform X1 [Nasonia vitripennis]|uniref:HAUS augmin-like complex subunit 6 N-terminal domain-containing protein n=1 Tax=Nasonia vitripennis TaxID=7425 RepID=A0A7M7G5N7_NASVI|nr:uncharacterized protein LOC100121437 isoform X1 [Nasonia vitripennis]
MHRVSAEFHKNVLLLTKFVEPNDEFKKHFKEGMFDKPNTTGFIQVSFYLLSVHYKENVKNKVHWPVICKQTENKFRNDVRECLMAIANENSDLNFPPIFASHLLLARGSKFLLIMWKFSLVVLRTYLQQEYNSPLTTAPKAGPCVELTKSFLEKVAADHHETVSHISKEREDVEVAEKNYQKKKCQEQNELKAIILKLKEEVKQVIVDAPVNDLAKKKLLNPEDNEIMSMWSGYLNDNIANVLQNDYQTLKDIDNLINYISNIVLNLAGNSLTLNSSNFDKINADPIYKLIPPEKQVLLYDLYHKDSLSLQNLFSVFHLLLQKYAINVKKSEFSKCNVQLQMSNKDLKTAVNHFQTLHEEIVNFTSNELKKDDSSALQNSVSNIPEFDKVLFMPSPSIQINSYEGERNNYQTYLQLTPVEGAHKQLFSRHAFNNEKSAYALKKKPMPVQRINFDDSTLHETSSDKFSMTQQRFNTPSKLQRSNFKNVDKYSRIFSTRKPNDNRVNRSVMMMMSSTGNSMLPLMSKQHCISLMDSCNSSQEFSQGPLLMNPNMNSTIEPAKLEESENVSQRSNKRRSIGDLVERYKKLLQKRDTNSQERIDPTREPLGEEPVA